MRISDRSSDVCSSDLQHRELFNTPSQAVARHISKSKPVNSSPKGEEFTGIFHKSPGTSRAFCYQFTRDRKSVVSGKRVSVRVIPGGRRMIKKQRTDKI